MHPVLLSPDALSPQAGNKVDAKVTATRTAAAEPLGFCTQGELPAAAITLEVKGLGPLTAPLPAELGVGPLQLRVHQLLVYGPGQFFKPHQDTEKHAGMVTWPLA